MFEILFFWLPLLLIIHSYLLYPILLQILARTKHTNQITFEHNDNLPNLSILLSVYNEEKIIEQRIQNLYTTNYPTQKIEVLVGSDGSTDNTNTILKKLQALYPSLKIYLFAERSGKANTLNRIANEAVGPIWIMTDAKVLFSPQAIFQLVKHFKNAKIGIIGGNIVNKKFSSDGISVPEKAFMNNEIKMKFNEGKIWQKAIGVYGACYAVRKELFTLFPKDIVVEDFYQNMQVLKKNKQSIMEINAVCFEDVPNQISDEFRRKIRISVGNFQNLVFFKNIIFRFNALGFCLLSHKIIRWLGPLFLVMLLISNSLLCNHKDIYFFLLIIQLFLITIPIIDFFLRKIRIDIIILRFITHFYLMNLALLIGFIKYIKGAKANVWEPTKR